MSLIHKINLQFWLGVAVTTLFIVVLLYRVKFEEVILTVREANYLFVVPAIGIYFVALYFRALRWRYILSPLARIPVTTLFIVVILGYTANNLLPARLGEIVRAYYLARKSNVRDGTALATIAVERVYDGITLLVLGAVSICLLGFKGDFINIANFHQSKIFYLGIGAVVVFGAALAFVTVSTSSSIPRLVNILLTICPERLRPTFERHFQWFIDGLNVANTPSRHFGIFIWSCPIWLLESSMYLLIAYSFHIDQRFESLYPLIWIMVLLTTTSNLATAIPSSIGGIGPFEIVAQQTLVIFGISATTAGIYAAFLHLIALWLPITLIGLLILWHQNWSLTNIKLESNSNQGSQ